MALTVGSLDSIQLPNRLSIQRGVIFAQRIQEKLKAQTL